MKIILVIVTFGLIALPEFKVMTLEDLTGMRNDTPVLIDVRGMFEGEESNKRERVLLYKVVSFNYRKTWCQIPN